MEKIINKKLITVSYPVGVDIKGWDKTVNAMANIIKSLVEEEDLIALAVTGSSGAMLGAMAALKLKKYRVDICHLKKDGENSHSSQRRPILDTEKAFIIDDQIDSGATVNRILNAYPEITFEAIIVGGSVCATINKGSKRLYCGE